MSLDEGAVDQSTILRLTNIKYTYEHALRLLENPTPLDGAVALVLIDSVLEAAFKLVLDKTEQKLKGRDPSFPELLNVVVQSENLDDMKDFRLSLLVLHRARNGFQHHGIIPDLNTILEEYKPLAERVLRSISRREAGYSWEEISLALLIKSEAIRKLYRKSEIAFLNGDYVTATAYLVYTFEVMKTIARMFIFGSGLSMQRARIQKLKKDPTIEFLTILDEEIETFKLGLNYVDLRNYLDMAQHLKINSILYQIPVNVKEEEIIDGFKRRLTTLDANLLKEWCINMRYPVLRFITRNEAEWRFSLRLLDRMVSNLSKVLEIWSKGARVTSDTGWI